MPQYRVYQLDDKGHISDPPRIIEADTDAVVIALTMQFVDDYDLEIWDEARRVGLVECRRDAN